MPFKAAECRAIMTACKGAGSQRFVCEQLEAVVAFLLQSCTRDLVIKPRPHHKIYKGWQKQFSAGILSPFDTITPFGYIFYVKKLWD